MKQLNRPNGSRRKNLPQLTPGLPTLSIQSNGLRSTSAVRTPRNLGESSQLKQLSPNVRRAAVAGAGAGVQKRYGNAGTGIGAGTGTMNRNGAGIDNGSKASKANNNRPTNHRLRQRDGTKSLAAGAAELLLGDLGTVIRSRHIGPSADFTTGTGSMLNRAGISGRRRRQSVNGDGIGGGSGHLPLISNMTTRIANRSRQHLGRR